MKKVFLTLILSLVLSCSIFANEHSQKYISTAETIEDNTYYLFNLTDWQFLDFQKFLAYIDCTKISNGYLYGATKKKADTIFCFGWDGNLWSENSTNNVKLMYGVKNFAIGLNCNFSNAGSILSKNVTYSNDYFSFYPEIEFGFKLSNKAGLSASIGFEAAKAAYNTSTSIKQNIFTADAGFYTKLKTSANFHDKLFFGYNGQFSNIAIDNQKNTSNKLSAGYTLNYNVSPKFIYGFKTEIPVTIEKVNDVTSIKIEGTLCNGFQTALSKTFTLSGGIKTQIPSIKFIKDESPETGSLINMFYCGLSANLSNTLNLDFGASVSPSSTSLSEIWDKAFSISVTAKF